MTQVAVNDRYGGVEVDESGKVIRFGPPAKAAPALINAGCYLLDAKKVNTMLVDFPQKFSLEADFLTFMAARGLVGASLQPSADFIDIGVAADYHCFCRRFTA